MSKPVKIGWFNKLLKYFMMNDSEVQTPQVLNITMDNAIKAYNEGCNDVKRVLENLLGKTTFIPANIREQINGWDDIIRLSGVNPDDYKLRSGETADELAQRQVKLIASVYNQGTVLDPLNTSQYKYFPWFRIVKDANKPSGFGLSYFFFGCWGSDSTVGVRLCFKSSADAEDAGKKFISIYENLLIR
jgi:hypothetical protein